MNKIPEFSIVTVCFNSEKTIRTTIESILNQKFKDYEYIIVDGVSKDSTMDIVKSYETKFEGRLIYKSEPDKGIYDAFNKGIRMSRGKYVWIVNSDDYIEPNALEKLTAITSQYTFENAPIISAATRFIKGDHTTVIHFTAEKAEKAYKKDLICSLHPSTLVPLNAYNNIGLYNENFIIAGDLDWLNKAYGSKIPFIFIDTVVTNMTCEGISNIVDMKKSYIDRSLYYKSRCDNKIIYIYNMCKWFIRFTYKYYIKRMIKIKRK